MYVRWRRMSVVMADIWRIIGGIMADGNTSEWRGNDDTGRPCKIFEKVQNRSGAISVTPTPPPLPRI